MNILRALEISTCCFIWGFACGQVCRSQDTCSKTATKSLDEGNQERPPAREKKIYTNEDLIRLRSQRRINQVESSPTVPSKKSGSRASGNPASLAGYKDDYGHDRNYWQNKIRPLKDKLHSLALRIEDLRQRQSEMSATSGIKVSRRGRLQASGDTRQAIARQAQALERKRADLVKSIQEVEEEARKAQALPEWLR